MDKCQNLQEQKLNYGKVPNIGQDASPIEKGKERIKTKLKSPAEVAVDVTQRAFDFLSEYGED